MCGIIGQFHANAKVHTAGLRAGMTCMKHRGPDGEGLQTFMQGSVGLGHVRLSILDTSEAGRQPMRLPDVPVWIVFNGEIYNYIELRKELGGTFFTGTDTEVLLRAYVHWGHRCLDRLIGMFAFAIYDGRTHTLFAARDRLGQKPLYYHIQGCRFSFASEIKALLALDGIPRLPDEATIHAYLLTGMLDGTAETFFRDIRNLPPGSSCRIDARGKVRFSRYWRPPEPGMDPVSAAEYGDMLTDAIRLRLRRDVNLGCCLSGGIDSTLLLSKCNAFEPDPITAYSVLFEEPGCSEGAYAAEAARRLGNRIVTVHPTARMFVREIETQLWHLDEPVKSPGVFPQWEVAKRASRDVKILFDGQGPDEMLGGYPYFFPDYWRALLMRFPFGPVRALWVVPCTLFSLLYHNRQFVTRYPFLKMARAGLGGLQDAERSSIMSRDFYNREYPEPVPCCLPGGWSGLRAALVRATFFRGLPALLRYGDRSFMAHSVENREPYLDHRLVEAAFRLPLQQTIHGDWTKVALRNIARDMVPEVIRLRKNKLGYPIPWAQWLRGDLKAWAHARIFDGMVDCGWMDPALLMKRWREHQSGRKNQSALLWRAVNLNIWYRKFFLDQAAIKPS